MIKRNFGENTTFETRGEANEKIDKNKRYRQIIRILRANESGMTAKEISVKMYALGYTEDTDRNNASPRLTELMAKGLVEPLGKTVCKYTGKTVTVFGLREKENA